MTKFVGISGAAIGAIFTIVYFAQGVFATTKEKQSTTKAEKAKWEEFEDQSASDAAGCFITCVASLIALATLRIA